MADHVPQPRVSILIPNYNNGRASSRDGQTDLIGDLLQSLHDTLHDDPTPLEIIAYDDGSTDDSLDTLRAWSQKTWRGGQPFLELIEAPHCGVLARTANVLVGRSRGDILVRLDGDTLMLTRHWARLLCQVFDEGPPRLGVVGPKQLRPDGRIHAFGDWLLHPKGYHHIAAGFGRHDVRCAIEVDHVMGCFYCCKRSVYDELGGYDEQILRGQTIDFGLRARLKGWSCVAVPHIEYVHRHGLRSVRSTKADTPEGVRQTLDTFRRKWGFDRIAPDLDVVRKRYAGTPLLWNAQVFGVPVGEEEAGDSSSAAALKIEQSEWQRYAQEPAWRQHVDLRLAITRQVVQQTGQPRRAAVVGCGAGLLTHLLAVQGLPCIGIDRDPAKIALARQCVARQSYPVSRPEFLHQRHPRQLPLAEGEADLLLLYDQIEHHPNPVGLLGEAARVLGEGKWMIIVTARPQAMLAAAPQLEHRYFMHELIGQIHAVGGWQVVSDPRWDDPRQPLIVVAKRVPIPAQAEEAAPAVAAATSTSTAHAA